MAKQKHMNIYTKVVLVAGLCAAFAVGGAILMSSSQAATSLENSASLTLDNEFTGTVNQFPSVKIGKQGIGGVTFFNGTIINATTDDNGNAVPVTFGDDVRVDGSVWRGSSSGTSDSQAFKIDDNVEVTGNLDTSGNSLVSGDLDVSGTADFGGEVNMNSNQYLKVGTTNSAPSASDCDHDSERGRLILDTSPAGNSLTLWGCKGSVGWTSVTF